MNADNTIVIPPSGLEYCINARARPQFQSNPLAFNISMSNNSQAMREGAGYRVVLRNIQFQNNIPNINSYNNSFAFYFNGTLYTSVLAVENYTITTLLSSMNTVLNGVNAGLGVTYDTNAKLMTLNIPANSTFRWYRGVVSSSIPDNRLYKTAPYDRFLALIGFIDLARTGITTTTTSASSITGTSLVNLFGTTFVDFTVNCQLNCIHMQPFSNQILARVPVLVDYGQVVRYEPAFPISFNLEFSSISTLQLSCYDEWGNMITDVPFDTSMELQLLIIPLNQGND